MTESEADVDTRAILDQVGAEKLLSDGDMLISKNATTERVQCGFISSHEIDALTTAISNQKGPRKSYNTPYYLPEPKDDNDGESEGTVDMHRRSALTRPAAVSVTWYAG